MSLFSEKAPQEPCKYHTNYCRFRARARKADICTQKLHFYEKSASWCNFSGFLETSSFLVQFCTFCALGGWPGPLAGWLACRLTGRLAGWPAGLAGWLAWPRWLAGPANGGPCRSAREQSFRRSSPVRTPRPIPPPPPPLPPSPPEPPHSYHRRWVIW